MRVFSSLIGIAVGLIVSAAVLSDFSVTLTAWVVATGVFWVVHIVADLLALKVFFRDPSFLMLLVVSLGATVVSLIVVELFVSGLSISGAVTYVVAALIIWACTSVSLAAGRHRLRERR
ncbi:MAG TPA: hypothetical protein VGP67_07545 [Gaiellales bacterium]|jgi:hypothetical protein|nr:hypothetical protein [Gaiellales bacterium]